MGDVTAYRPTAGMLAALTAAASGRAVDHPEAWRCRQRGLMDRAGRLTSAGAAVVRGCAHG